MRPLGCGPGARERDVGGEVDLVQLVVDELPNVPREIVVSEKWRNFYFLCGH